MKVKLDAGAIMPTRAHETDAGLDLYTREIAVIKAGESHVFDTGVHIQLPHGTYGEIQSKSGLNIKNDIVSCGGTIDEGYTGSICVKLYNLGGYPYFFNAGDKIAQLVIQPCLYETCELAESLDESERGDCGFGSTGR